VILSITLVVLDLLRSTKFSWQPNPENPQRTLPDDKRT
jgi:hypothetical protein